MGKINTKTFGKFIDIDPLDLLYFDVTHDINEIEDVEYAQDIIFQYWRKHGFPHYTVDELKKQSDMKSLKVFDEKSIFSDKKLGQTMHGLSLAWSYFPHWTEVACGPRDEPLIKLWDDDAVLKTVIRKTWDWQLKHGSGNFTINRLRQNFKIYGAGQTVSNFRPTVAKYIYNTYGNNGTVWDMSCGWGGRLLGFLTSDCKRYIGTDPSTKTYDGLQRMVSELGNDEQIVELHKLGSEVFRPEKNEVDLCFTSPPYFDTERYSDEPTQSYKKYPSEELWINGFLTKTIQNCHYGLKPNGYMILNIANTRQHANIETRTVEISEETGFELVDTLYLVLSSVAGKGEKLEPVFVFRKKS